MPSKRPPRTPASKTDLSRENNQEEAEREDTLTKLMEMIRPLVEFHAASEDADPSDIRIYWDVRIVKGKDIALAKSNGSASLPAALEEKEAPLISEVIEREVAAKIGRPLAARMQALVEASLEIARGENPAMLEDKEEFLDAADVAARIESAQQGEYEQSES